MSTGSKERTSSLLWKKFGWIQQMCVNHPLWYKKSDAGIIPTIPHLLRWGSVYWRLAPYQMITAHSLPWCSTNRRGMLWSAMEWRGEKNSCWRLWRRLLEKSSILICHKKWVGFQQVDMEIKIFKNETFFPSNEVERGKCWYNEELWFQTVIQNS